MPFVIGMGAALLLTPVAMLLGRSVGLVDRPGDALKIHTREIPVLGGAAVVAAVAAATLAPDLGWPVAGVALATAVALVAGTVDDAAPLPPVVRVAALTAAGLALVLWTGLADLGPAAGVGVVLLALACGNGVNILDGQDGLAAGVAAVAATGLALSLELLQAGPPFLPLALAGALVGFLAWNWPPARVYLGNGGAYAVGVLLALPAADLVAAAGWRGLLAAGACMAVPAFEVAFTVARRAASRDRLSAGDRLHSYDLVAARVGRGRSTAVFVGVAALAVGIGVVISVVPLWAGIALASFGAGAAVLWGNRLWSRRSITT